MSLMDYEKLLKKYPTPFYYFDCDQLTKRIQYLRSVLPSRVKLCFAAKANPFLLKVLEDKTDYFEICSPGEFSICEDLHIPMEKIVLSGVYKDPRDLESYFENNENIHLYTIESISQYHQLQALSRRYQRSIDVALRLSSGNQFGLDIDQVKELIASRMEEPYLHIKGIQYFSGTQKRRSRQLEKEITLLQNFLAQMKEEYAFDAELFEYGPGLPVDYFNTGFDEDTFLKDFASYLERLDPSIEVVLEIGRSMSASCGYYVSRVVDLKNTGTYHYAILDGGIHHLVYFGQSMAMRVPPHEVYPQRETKTTTYQICGALCTANDVLIKDLNIPTLQMGDAFIFKMAGAYCPMEGMNLFLSRHLPCIVLGQQDESHLVRGAIPTYQLNTPKGDK